MSDCKNCPYTDEYCASGDCNKIQAKDVACNERSLTEQCIRGELPLGEYYIECKDGSVTTMYLGDDEYSVRSIKCKGFKVLALVPSYEEYEQLENWSRFTGDYHALREAKEITEYEKVELLEKVKHLKDLLKECADLVSSLVVYETEPGAIKQLSELWQNIDELLK